MNRRSLLVHACRALGVGVIAVAVTMLSRRGQLRLLDDPNCPSPCSTCAAGGRCRAPQAVTYRNAQ